MKTKYNIFLIILLCSICVISGAVAQVNSIHKGSSSIDKLKQKYQLNDDDIYVLSKDPTKRDENPYVVFIYNGDICIVNAATQEILVACKPNYADPIIRIFSKELPILTVYLDKKKTEPISIQLTGLTDKGWFSKNFSGSGELLNTIKGTAGTP